MDEPAVEPVLNPPDEVSPIETAEQPPAAASVPELEPPQTEAPDATMTEAHGARARITIDRIRETANSLLKNPHDTEAWHRLIVDAEESGNLDNIRAAYEALLKQYPNTPSAQIRYISHFLNNQKTFAQAEALFKRFLKATSPSVNLYRYYLTYIRRINTGSDTQSRETIRKSFEFAINSIGSDKDSGDIWSDYIDFINSGENSSTWEEQQKMDMVRKAYQRAVQTPLDNIEKLWSDYESFEVKLNRITAKKFMSELSPAYMQARSVWRDLTKHVVALYPPEVPLPANSKPDLFLPAMPSFTVAERQLVGKWKAYLKWEESNPLMIEEKDKKDLQNRIQLVYRKALVRMRFYPEIWFMAWNWTNSVGKHDEALNLLKTGLEANQSSFLLTFAYTEVLELRKEYAQVHTTYSKFLDIQKATLTELQQSIDEEQERTKKAAETAKSDESIASQLDLLSSSEEIFLSGDFDDRKKEYALTYIMYMRFARRAEGVKASRSLFGRARRDKYASWEVYEAGALMEYHTTQDKEVATRIFEAGMALHSTQKEFVLRYLTFLISVNDENNARALFERVIGTFTADESRPIWERWARYEHQYGDLEASQKIDKRMAEMYPNRFILLSNALPNVTFILDWTLLLRVILEPESERIIPAEQGTLRLRSDGESMEDINGNATPRQRGTATVSGGIGSSSRRRSPPPPEKDRSFSRRHEKEREEEKPVILPQALSWFIGQLPAPSAFDGKRLYFAASPVFRTDDLLNLFKTAVIPSTTRPKSPTQSAPPSRTAGRPPPDYSPYQGPNVNSARRRY
ncbi:Suf-domain-containing protein [Gymnopus androsaceus JB14]|uniref:mRNA 3'-end-processing protein RNA14 n=1 Tax=Gymnopus androsaceus JB14 TaxID=1447944 RepID=A0A6A4IP24_9AGAR|nr:Suf-domain-containing protein [Gymnopus androsaceus JB14]